MKKLLASILVLGFIFTGCSKSDDVLVLGTNAEYPPFEYIAPNEEGVIGKYDGLDMQIAKAIGKELGKEVVIEDMPFDSLIVALTGGKVDAIISAMTITDERKENVDFTSPYFTSEQYILVAKDDTTITSGEDLAGKSIGVQMGTTGDFIATDNIENSDVRRYNRPVDAVLDLKNGKIDAVLTDSGVAGLYAEEYSDSVNLITDTSTFEVEEYGIGVAKGDTELLEALDVAVKRLVDEGKITEWYMEYNAE
ncbi:MAG: basic amino acid ABC transporter substrate-binding protein [Lachnospirales bacterium]